MAKNTTIGTGTGTTSTDTGTPQSHTRAAEGRHHRDSRAWRVLRAVWDLADHTDGPLAQSPAVRGLLAQADAAGIPQGDTHPATWIQRRDGKFDPGLAAMAIVARCAARGLALRAGAGGASEEEIRAIAAGRLAAIRGR